MISAIHKLPVRDESEFVGQNYIKKTIRYKLKKCQKNTYVKKTTTKKNKKYNKSTTTSGAKLHPGHSYIKGTATSKQLP